MSSAATRTDAGAVHPRASPTAISPCVSPASATSPAAWRKGKSAAGHSNATATTTAARTAVVTRSRISHGRAVRDVALRYQGLEAVIGGPAAICHTSTREGPA